MLESLSCSGVFNSPGSLDNHPYVFQTLAG